MKKTDTCKPWKDKRMLLELKFQYLTGISYVSVHTPLVDMLAENLLYVKSQFPVMQINSLQAKVCFQWNLDKKL